MADLSSYEKIVREASSGEEVRDAFIQMLKLLYEMEGSIGSLNGHPESYFATHRQLEEFSDKINDAIVFGESEEDRKPTEGSTMVLTSGQIYEASLAVKDVLKDLNHKLIPSNDLIENIKQIEKAKKVIGDAIHTQSGGKVKKKQLENFEKYNEYIRDLTAGTSVHFIQDHTFSKNGDYYADQDNEDPNITYAYGRFVTDVKFDTDTRTVRGNDTLTPSGNKIGFSRVSVNTSSTSTGHGRSGSTRGGSNVDENGIQETATVTQNGSWSPSGAIGVRTLVVDVTDIEVDFDATYIVNFYDSEAKNHLIHSEKMVPYNGSCSCPEDKIPEKTGLYFIGWDPAPFKIRADTDCIAQYSDQAPSVEEISYTWDEIVEARGMNCPLGSYKTLSLNGGFGSIVMQKVYSGEDGSSSSWLSRNWVNTRKYYYNDGRVTTGTVGWSNSDIRRWLNNEFLFNALPEIINDNIVPVRKYSYEFSYEFNSKFLTEVQDKVWMPSLKEVLGDIPPAERDICSEYANKDFFYTSGAGGAYNNSVQADGQIILNWGFNRNSNLDHFYPEYKGVHYYGYPSWKAYGIDGSTTANDGWGFYLAPTSTDNLVKGSTYPWYTRSCTTFFGGFNSNDYLLGAATFSPSGGYQYASKYINGHSGSFNESNYLYPVIGFCL